MQKKKAVIFLFPRIAGGRRTGIVSGYRPNIVFGFSPSLLECLWKDDCYQYTEPNTETIKDVDVEFDFDFEDEQIYPGQGNIIQLIISETRMNYLGVSLLEKGGFFLIREGVRLVGTGMLV